MHDVCAATEDGVVVRGELGRRECGIVEEEEMWESWDGTGLSMGLACVGLNRNEERRCRLVLGHGVVVEDKVVVGSEFGGIGRGVDEPGWDRN